MKIPKRSKQDSRWQKKHGKELAKSKKRHKRGKIVRGRVSMSQAEQQYLEAQYRERQKKAPPLLARWSRRLRLWFISQRPVVLARKLRYWYSERQFRG